MSNFKECLAFGKKYEEKSKQFYTYDEGTMEDAPPTCSGYDFLFMKDGREYKVEVKSDKMTATTGNLCIEHRCSNKPSGLSVTEADDYVYWVIHTDETTKRITKEEVYIIPTEKIKAEAPFYPSRCGGFGLRAEFYLVPVDIFSEYKVKEFIL